MKKLLKMTLGTACMAGLLALPFQASALLITPSTLPQWTGNQTGQGGPNGIDAAIASILGSSVELYKQNEGNPQPSDVGLLAGSYQTTFNGDLSGGTITYVGGNFVGATAYMLVKDGNHTPAWYLFNLTAIGGWNGIDDLVLTGFWPNGGAISHVTLYGTSTPPDDVPPPGVPDGGTTLLLLGAAMAGFAALRRKLS